MPEQRLCYPYRARQAHIGSMKRRHKRNVRESSQPRPDDAAREPPMSVYRLRLETPAGTHGLNEIGTEETNEGKFRLPRRCDVARHVAGVRELLVSARRIAKPVDRHSFHLFGGRDSSGGGRHDVDLHILAAQGNREAQDERASGVPFPSRERVREKQYVHGYLVVVVSRSRERSSIRAASWLSSARCAAINSPMSPVAKKTLPTVRHVSTRLMSGLKPTPPMTRQRMAMMPTSTPTTNKAAPSMPNSRRGLRANRSSNQTASISSSPTGMRPIPNLDCPAWRG